jgi:hypothetical protein
LPDCASAPACEHGRCHVASGEAACICDEGYGGATCGDCAAGYQDNDGDGTCLPSCSTGSCGAHSHCDDATGVAVCACDPGYADNGAGACDIVTAACAHPLELDIEQSHLKGSTVGASAENSGTCQADTGPELAYRFQVAQPLRIRFQMSGFDTVMYIRETCGDDSSELACNDDEGGNRGSLIERDFAPGEYYLFADGWGQESGQFDLAIDRMCASGYLLDAASQTCVVDPCASHPCTQPHMTLCTPVPPTGFECACDLGYISDGAGVCMVDPNPNGEGCANSIPLTPGNGIVHGTTSDAGNDGTGTCGGVGPDRVYDFTLAARTMVRFQMDGYDSVLHLRSTCSDPSSEVACDDDGGGGSNSMISTILEPGSYYLFADSFAAGGEYDLSYTFQSDPCANDPCRGMQTCAPSADWSSYSCVCPAGQLPYADDCVDDPCSPNPCVGGPEHRTRCESDLATGNHTCTCNFAFIEDPANPDGACVPDPNGNEWAWLVYLNGDNNLEREALADLREMAAAGSTPNLHIVALLDTYEEGGGTARRIHVMRGGQEVVENMGELDMGRWETLADFGVWAVENYPARHYALVLWNHGGGWRSMRTSSPLVKAFSNDEHGTADGISISNGDYARALAQITAATRDKLDIVGFDACLMGMWEVAEATAPYARTLVASSDTIPGTGWSYDKILAPLAADPKRTGQQIGITIVDTYFAADSENATLAVSNLDTIPELRQAMSEFADALRADPAQYAAIDTARSTSQTFYFDEYRDLGDFARRVSGDSGASPQLVSAAQALLAQLDRTIVYSRAQSSHPGSHGLSVYLPGRGAPMDPAYTGDGASWSRQTTWDEFLVSFTK